MTRLRTTLLACLMATGWSAAMPATSAPGEQPRLRITQGALQGIHEDGIDVFRGIPFAGDTGGEHRWRPPTPPDSWSGTRDASRFGPICPQSTQARNGVRAPWLASFEMSEDCLNLNVYRPADGETRPLPVMVWVHGGFARIGTGSRHDGKNLAREGVVVVTVNYRLDRLGLFAHPAITAEQPGALLGNYALMDVLAALHWVKDNIAAFGGDPNNVTLFGQSSGGVAVTALMGAPAAAGLFHRAIAQSGVMADLDRIRLLHQDLPNAPSLESDGVAMARALMPEGGETVTASSLRALPWEQIIAYSDTQPAGALVPVIDGRLLPGSVMRRFADGEHLKMPFMVGTTSWEQSLFVRFKLPLAAVLAGVSPAEARAAYPGLDDDALVSQWLADSGFHAPSRFLANANANTRQPSWVYRFDHIPQNQPSQPGAAHSDDVPYLFDPLALPLTAPQPGAEAELAALMRRYWANFARTGNPNADDVPNWPAWQPSRRTEIMRLDIPASSVVDERARTLEFHVQRLERSARP